MEAIEHHDTARDRILNAVGCAFGADGFSGVGTKAIAREACVAQGLPHYHFDNKQGLHAAMIARRSGVITADRLERLDLIDTDASDSLAPILRAFPDPRFCESSGARACVRILPDRMTGRGVLSTLITYVDGGICALTAQRPTC